MVARIREHDRGSALARFLALYFLLYAGFGVELPFLPALFHAHGLSADAIGIVLAAGTGIRLIAGPLAGRLADRLGRLRLVFAACAVGAGLAALGYLPVWSFPPLLAIALAQAAMLAPLVPLSDALALGSARSFRYGWVRGAGSAAFIVGVVLAGHVVGGAGLAAMLWLHAGLLAAAALAVMLVPPLVANVMKSSAAGPDAGRGARGIPEGIAELFGLTAFRRVVAVAALVEGSHALHDSFAVIRWEAAGIAPGTIGLLWAEAVAAEVVVFLLLGRPLLDRLGVAGASALAALAGVVRWAVMAETAWFGAVAAVQPLHGLTFALMHLAVMRLIASVVPGRLAATAQAVYGTLCVGGATALLTLASGPLYARWGAGGFWVMGALCAVALPLAFGLRDAARGAPST